MRTITIHVRISEELDRDLGMVAVATGRSKAWLIAEALKSYVGMAKAFVEAVEEGIKAADESRLVDHESVVAELERRYRSNESALD
jgi:predicted transcriptional regulator